MAAKSTTVEEFNLRMDEIKGISPLAHSDLLKTDPRFWCRAFFDTLTKCEMVDNNLSECFNSWIVEARYKPIIQLLDDIRLQVMERIYKKRDWMSSLQCEICPRIIKKLNYSIEGTRFCKSTWTGGSECEVRDIDGGQWVVDMVGKTCSCRRWELTGIPCTHGCTAMFSMNEKPEDKVDPCFNKRFYIEAYSHLLRPMKGSLYWPKTGFPDILPPKARRMPGRPKKHRRREQGEEGAGSKLSKKGVLMKCSQCLVVGHNKATCKATAEEIAEIQNAIAEAKKAQSEAARAEAAQRVRLYLSLDKCLSPL